MPEWQKKCSVLMVITYPFSSDWVPKATIQMLVFRLIFVIESVFKTVVRSLSTNFFSKIFMPKKVPVVL